MVVASRRDDNKQLNEQGFQRRTRGRKAVKDKGGDEGEEKKE